MDKTSIVRVQNIIGALAVSALLLPACHDSDDEIVVETNELGITKVRIEHREHDGEQLLLVRGLSATGDSIANLTLRTGMVLYSPEPDLMPPGWSAGTELTVSVGDLRDTFVTPDRRPHATREPREPALASLVRLRAVADAVEAEAGIRFTRPPEVSGEIAFYPTSCASVSGNFPMAQGNPSQCCWETSGSVFHKTPTGLITLRYLSTPCTTSDGSSDCSGTACTYGPCGARIESGWPKGNSTSNVFNPNNQYANMFCGWDPTNAAGDGMPQDYPGYGAYGGVTASCPYTTCTNGVPGN